MKRFIENISGIDLMSALVLIMLGVWMWAMFAASSKADFKCAVYEEIREHGVCTTDNGEYRAGEVVEIDGKEVTIEIGRDLYVFLGNGFSVGQKVICEITSDDEIIDVL